MKENGESPDMSVSVEQLRKLCTKRAKEVYGEKLPGYVENRLREEMEYIENADIDFAGNFLAAAEMFDSPCFQDTDRYLIGYERALGASLIAYLLKITPFNPLEVSEDMKLYPFIFFQKVNQKLYINTSKRVKAQLVDEKNKCRFSKNISLYASPNLNLLDELQRRTKDIYVGNVREEEDEQFPADAWNLLYTEDIKYIPEFKDCPLTPRMLENVDCLNLTMLSKIIGLRRGSGTWLGNAEFAMEENENWLDKVITCEEDVSTHLIAHGLPHESVCRITETVRHGDKHLSDEDIDMLIEHKCESWFIKSAIRIKYAFSGAQSFDCALETKRLLYYLSKYRRVYIDVFNEIYGVKLDNWEKLKNT